MNRLLASVVAVLVLVLIASSMVFVVDEKHDAVLLSLGQMKEDITRPGVYFKWPPPLETLVLLDKRIQTSESDGVDRYLTSEKRDVLVGSMATWQIADAKTFYNSFSGDAGQASDRLGQLVRGALTTELAQHNMREIVNDKRESIGADALAQVKTIARDRYGIDVLDVRIRRVTLLPADTDALLRRMEGEQTQLANQVRANGEADGERIKADADSQAQVIVAEASEKAQVIKGDGDAKAAEIYAEAYQRDPDFYAFYKSLEAYRASFNDKRDYLILDPQSDFFRYLKNPQPAAPAKR